MTVPDRPASPQRMDDDTLEIRRVEIHDLIIRIDRAPVSIVERAVDILRTFHQTVISGPPLRLGEPRRAIALQTNVGYQTTTATAHTALLVQSRHSQTPVAATLEPKTIKTKSASQNDSNVSAGQSLG